MIDAERSAPRRRWWLVPVALTVALVLGVAAWGGSPRSAGATAADQPVGVPSVDVELPGGASLHLVRPDGPGPHPVLVHVPGGGWTTLDPSPVHHAFGHDEALAEGWAVATVRYRPADRPGIDAATQVTDVTEALEWIGSAEEPMGLGGPVVAVGHSAGAHLLSLAAPHRPPAAVVLVAGIYDVGDDVRRSPMLVEGLAAVGCGTERCEPPTSLLPVEAPAPAAQVTVVHGTADRVAPVDGARRYVDALGGSGAATELVLVEGGRHRGPQLDLAVRRAVDEALAQARVARSSR